VLLGEVGMKKRNLKRKKQKDKKKRETLKKREANKKKKEAQKESSFCHVQLWLRKCEEKRLKYLNLHGVPPVW
jgi:hypothetical protein